MILINPCELASFDCHKVIRLEVAFIAIEKNHTLVFMKLPAVDLFPNVPLHKLPSTRIRYLDFIISVRIKANRSNRSVIVWNIAFFEHGWSAPLIEFRTQLFAFVVRNLSHLKATAICAGFKMIFVLKVSNLSLCEFNSELIQEL